MTTRPDRYLSPAMADGEKRRYLRRAHGVTLEDFRAVLNAQNKECFFAPYGGNHNHPVGRDLYVHHLHSSGKRVCLLCHTCNTIWKTGVTPEQLEMMAQFMRITGYDHPV